MTREDKKRILRDYNGLIEYIADLKDKYEIEFAKATKVTSSGDGMPHAQSNESKAERSAVKLAELSERIAKAEKQKAIIDKAIKELKPRYSFIIKAIDIDGMSINRYSQKVRRSYRNCIDIHKKALDNLNL